MRAGLTLLELIVVVCMLWLCDRVLWRKRGQGGRAAALLLGFCAVFLSFTVASSISPASRLVTITALNEKNAFSDEAQVYLQDLIVDGKSCGVPAPISGQWRWLYDMYCWFPVGDERYENGMTDSISFEIGSEEKVEAVFYSNRWKGKVKIDVDGNVTVTDTYRDSDDGASLVVPLADPSINQAAGNLTKHLFSFVLILLLLCAAITGAVSIVQKALGSLRLGRGTHPYVQKLLSYQFLFEELVSRDFKKKYKRTVLGMVWSVLSPLLQLLVMKLVFSQFFGRSTDHYTTYLFCGNLVYSYFSESTSQGMSSLLGNAEIFTKVNVPKYLFLFSKNMQTLINFGLNLCVFFVFCAIDQIGFTWKFICLLYPMVMLFLFNIGVGLVLSAMFVFFRDIQYLWSVFTMLLMYMSAIFYTIDGYSYEVQCLFLANPVYLFIRYFRKIVIEAAIPTVWFHLLMLADVAVVLGIGCWMYKKYNHRFLYYV